MDYFYFVFPSHLRTSALVLGKYFVFSSMWKCDFSEAFLKHSSVNPSASRNLPKKERSVIIRREIVTAYCFCLYQIRRNFCWLLKEGFNAFSPRYVLIHWHSYRQCSNHETSSSPCKVEFNRWIQSEASLQIFCNIIEKSYLFQDSWQFLISWLRVQFSKFSSLWLTASSPAFIETYWGTTGASILEKGVYEREYCIWLLSVFWFCSRPFSTGFLKLSIGNYQAFHV